MQAMYTQAENMLNNGQPANRVAQSLIQQGLQANEAESIVEEVLEAQSKSNRHAGFNYMAMGVILCIVALVITLGTGGRGQEGGIYIVTWAVFAFGIWRILQGIGMLRSK